MKQIKHTIHSIIVKNDIKPLELRKKKQIREDPVMHWCSQRIPVSQHGQINETKQIQNMLSTHYFSSQQCTNKEINKTIVFREEANMPG